VDLSKLDAHVLSTVAAKSIRPLGYVNTVCRRCEWQYRRVWHCTIYLDMHRPPLISQRKYSNWGFLSIFFNWFRHLHGGVWDYIEMLGTLKYGK